MIWFYTFTFSNLVHPYVHLIEAEDEIVQQVNVKNQVLLFKDQLTKMCNIICDDMKKKLQLLLASAIQVHEFSVIHCYKTSLLPCKKLVTINIYHGFFYSM